MKEELEIQKKIDGFENYSVSNQGNVRNDITGRIMKKTITIHNGRKEYYQLHLRRDNKPYRFPIHQLVAFAFLDCTEYNKNRKMQQIDHIDNNGLNNNLNNLQIISTRENLIKDKKNKTSKYTGVSYNKKTNKQVASIYNKKYINLGHYNTEEEAYEKYLIYKKENNL